MLAAPGGGTFAVYLGPQAINASGQVLFQAGVSDGSDGIFIGTPAGLDVVARTGFPAPGGAFTGVSWGTSGLNDSGESAFGFADPDTNVGSVYRTDSRSGKTRLIAGPGDALPGGGTFLGILGSATAIKAYGDVALDAVVSGAGLDPGSPPGADGASAGVYLAPHGTHDLVDVARPGDPAPGGGVFDDAVDPSINGAGDVAFGGHVVGDDCTLVPGTPACLESAYLWHRATGTVVSLAHQGETSMPGGGNLVSGPCCVAQCGIDQRGWVAYPASLDEDTGGDGQIDSGMYVERGGQTSLVARTGTVLPGIGTVLDIGEPGTRPGPPIPPQDTGGLISRSGQVVLVVTLTDGREAIVRATPVRA